MKTLFLTFCLLAGAQSARAGLCSETPAGIPCRPDPTEETAAAKAKILKKISTAQSLERDVKRLEAAYRAVRDNPNSTLEEQFAACETYRRRKVVQDSLYKEALNLTEELYQVGPEKRVVSIGVPKDPAIGYVVGLSAGWDPQVTDSGPGVKLALKVEGSDNKLHYTGAVSMDPSQPDNHEALTTQDGRVLVLKGMFDLALKKKNPGILARLLNHEAKHFEHLCRELTEGKFTGWDSPEYEETGAYLADVVTAKDLFGMSDADVAVLRTHYEANRKALNRGQATSRAITPTQEALWKAQYENVQINLEDELAKLQAMVTASRAQQMETQRLADPVKKNWWENGDPEKFRRGLAKLKELPSTTLNTGYIPPPPLSMAFPKLSAFAVAACRAPDQVEIDLFLTPYYDTSYRGYDDGLAGRFAEGMDSCSRQLFFQVIELLRAYDWRQADRQWVINAVAYYKRPAPHNPAAGYAPPSNGERRGEPRSVDRSADDPSTPPPAVKHDPEGVALEQLREMEMRKRWKLRPVR